MNSCSLEFLGIGQPWILPKDSGNSVKLEISLENRNNILLLKCKSFFDKSNEIDSLKNTVSELNKGVESIKKLDAGNRVDLDRLSRNTEELKDLNRIIEEEFNRTLKNDKIIAEQEKKIAEQHIRIKEQHKGIKQQHEEIKEQHEGIKKQQEEIEAGHSRIDKQHEEIEKQQKQIMAEQYRMLGEVDKLFLIMDALQLRMKEFNRRIEEKEAEQALEENKDNIAKLPQEEVKEPIEINISQNIAVSTEIPHPEICNEEQKILSKVPLIKEKPTEESNSEKDLDLLAGELLEDLKNKKTEQPGVMMVSPLDKPEPLNKTVFFFISVSFYLGLFVVQTVNLVLFLADRIYSRIEKLIPSK